MLPLQQDALCNLPPGKCSGILPKTSITILECFLNGWPRSYGQHMGLWEVRVGRRISLLAHSLVTLHWMWSKRSSSEQDGESRMGFWSVSLLLHGCSITSFSSSHFLCCYSHHLHHRAIFQTFFPSGKMFNNWMAFYHQTSHCLSAQVENKSKCLALYFEKKKKQNNTSYYSYSVPFL